MTKPRDETLAVWTALLIAHRRLTTQLDADLRAGADMALDEYDVLYQTRRAGRPLRMSELASRVLISRPSTTRVVDHLVRRGFLAREHDVFMAVIHEAGRYDAGRAAVVSWLLGTGLDMGPAGS